MEAFAEKRPGSFRLSQNYPNPFNASTEIQFELAESCIVRLDVYNLLGEKWKTLIHTHLEAGEHRVILDGSELTSGVYFYRIDAGKFIQIKKCIYIK